MTDDTADSRILTWVGIGLVLFIAFQLVVVALVFINPPNAGEPTPESSWRVERINETHVHVTHAGGDPVAPRNLVVTVNGFERHVDWPTPVTEGTGIVVGAEPGGVIRLYWTGGEGNRDLLGQWRVE